MAGGFPAGVRFTPVPNPLLSSYLEQVQDAAELKVILRAVWMFHRKKGSPQPLRPDELWSDRTVAAALGLTGAELETAVLQALDSATERGILLRVEVGRDVQYFLNTAPERRAVGRTYPQAAATPAPTASEAWPATTARNRNVFVAYEENIGELTPAVAELLEEAEASYPAEWIVDAIVEAVAHNARSWSYVARILERWAGEGRRHGEPGRDPEAVRSEEFYRAYQERLRDRGNR